MIKFKNKEDYDNAVAAIESWDKGKNRKVENRGGGRHAEPDLTKPYTTYNDVDMTIDYDYKVLEIFEENSITYLDESISGCTCDCENCKNCDKSKGDSITDPMDGETPLIDPVIKTKI